MAQAAPSIFQDTKNIPPPNTLWAWDVLWVGILAMVAFAGYPLVPFHGDESMQVFMSRDYAYHVLDGNVATLFYDPTHPTDLEQNLRLLNGTVSKYLIGLAWDLAGYTVDDINQPWYWGESYAFNTQNGFSPPEALLQVSRLPSALMLAGSVILAFFVGKAFAGRPVAYMATLLIGLNPALLLNGRRAMMEGSLLFGMLLTLLMAFWYLSASAKRRWLYMGLLGLAAGFALASKHTNAFSIASIWLGCLLFFVFRERRSLVSAVLQLVLAAVLALGTFYALNPAWWRSPIGAAQYVLQERTALLAGQTQAFGGYANPIERLQGFRRQVFVGKPMYYEIDGFMEPLAASITTYEQSVYAGFVPIGADLALIALFLIGLACIANVLALPDVDAAGRWLIGTWTIGITLITLITTPLEWQRYYLSAIVVMAFVAPLGLVWVFRLYVGDAATHSRVFRGSARATTQK